MELKDAEILVVKVGTSTLTYENGKVNLRRLEELCRTLIQCIVVGDQCRQTVFEFRNTVVKAFCAVTQRL